MSASKATPRAEAHKWEFKARFRRHAFGWKSQPAITRLKQAVTEIKKVAKKEPVLAAEGAVVFLERVSPALEQVDSSSGSIGTAVGNAIAELVPLIVNAPADAKTRDAWLERLFEAHQADQIPYIERLAVYWGELCASKEVASAWADKLVGITRMALSPDKNLRGHFHGTSACLSALYRAERYDELIALLDVERTLWDYKQWAAKALAAQGRKAEALRYAEDSRSPWASDLSIDRLCEEILLSSGIDEGKWFAAAKDTGLYDEALALASRTPCDPKTLTRAARDYAEKQPAFAVGSGLLSLYWLVQGYGYEITSVEVWEAYRSTLAAAERHGSAAEVRERVRKMVATERAGGFVTKVLGRELGL